MIVTAEVRRSTIKNLKDEIKIANRASWAETDHAYVAILREDLEIIRAIKPGDDVINVDALEIIEAYHTNG